MVPATTNAFWAPLYGLWYGTQGTRAIEPTGEIRKLQQLYDQLKQEVDNDARLRIGQQILGLHDKNVWIIGTVMTPAHPLVANADLVNVRTVAMESYHVGTRRRRMAGAGLLQVSVETLRRRRSWRSSSRGVSATCASTLFLITIVSFLVIQLPPGDYLTTLVANLQRSGQNADPADLAALKERYGLDQPLWTQYWKWISNIVLHGDFGQSFQYGRPVSAWSPSGCR